MDRSDTSMKTYFAYGSNLLVNQMASRCPDHKLLGIGVLTCYRFLIGERGFATILPDASGEVIGALYNISASDETMLDRKEGVAKGCYRKAIVSVAIGSTRVDAMTYIDDRITPGVPSPDYIKKILDGATQAGLPEVYRSFLAKFAS